MKISSDDVREFKDRYSDENKIIANIIQHQLHEKFEEIIVDVGAGTGDITAAALPSKRVVQIDVLDYDKSFLPEMHRRSVVDFFDYEAGEKIGTLFFSHVLQFIDQDEVRLNKKVQSLHPNKIITVTNVNDGFVGKLIQWILLNFDNPNPEVDLKTFPVGYEMECEVGFEGHVKCADFPSLSKQVSYLVDSTPTAQAAATLESFLRDHLSEPSFSINQKIKVYSRI